MCDFFTKYSLVYPDFEIVVAQVLSTIQNCMFQFFPIVFYYFCFDVTNLFEFLIKMLMCLSSLKSRRSIKLKNIKNKNTK